MSEAASSIAQMPRISAEDTSTLLHGRRTIHDFLPEPVPEHLIHRAVELARWAPNHYRTEPWRFYVLGEEARGRIATLNADLVRAKQGERAAEVKLKRWLAVPGWLLLTCARSDDPVREREDYAACCCAAQNLMLYLWAEGIGVKWTTGEVSRRAEFYAALGLAGEREFVVGLFWYGRPAAVVEQQRGAVETVLSHIA